MFFVVGLWCTFREEMVLGHPPKNLTREKEVKRKRDLLLRGGRVSWSLEKNRSDRFYCEAINPLGIDFQMKQYAAPRAGIRCRAAAATIHSAARAESAGYGGAAQSA